MSSSGPAVFRPRVRIRARARGGLWWRAPCAVMVWLVLAAPVVAAATAWTALHRAAAGLPEVPDLDEWRLHAPQTSKIVAADGTVTARLPFSDDGVVGYRRPVPYDEIPDLVVKAILAAEDRRFFEHGGVDAKAVMRAALANYRAEEIVEGASTISQQVARGLLPDDIGRQQTLRRKLREAIVARRIERAYSKQRIFEVYASHVFLGARAYGVAEASRAYFGKPLDALSPAEAALIAGLAQAPGRADPFVDRGRARARRDEVLRRMREAGFLSEDAYARARASPIELSPATPRYGRVAPWHTELARRQVKAAFPEAYARGGLRIETTAEPALAAAGADRAREHTGALAGDGDAPELAAVVWDHQTDYVELSLGGRDFGSSQFDRVSQACRQPGSAFKPVAYAAALEIDAITPGTPLRDGPITEYDPELGLFWKPDTAGHEFRGVALARDALALSLNAPAVDVLRRAGPRRVLALAQRLGIETDLDPVAPLALGASCVVPIELTAALATFARGGLKGDPIYVKRITRGDEVLVDRRSAADPHLSPADRLVRFAAAATAERERAMDHHSSFLVADMLSAVVETGTGARARSLSRPAAGKTGTTNRNVDTWFTGFTSRVAATVWIGHDDPTASLGTGRTGGTAALPLWMQLVELAEGDRPAAPAIGQPPEDLVTARVDPETGYLSPPESQSGVMLYFRPGTQPEERAGAPASVPSGIGEASREF